MEINDPTEEEWAEWRARLVEHGAFFENAVLLEEDTDDAVMVALQVASHLRKRKRDRRTKRWGGSAPGKSANRERNVREGAEQIYRDYFCEQPTYGAEHFERRYRMPRELLLEVRDAIVSYDRYFRERRDAAKKLGASSYQKLTAALRMLAYGASSDSLDEYCRISSTTARTCMEKFCRDICVLYGEKYLRMPNAEDLVRIQSRSAQRGFPGCMGSLDCMHWEWKNCPTAYHGQFKGKEKKPTIILEAVADSDLWIWHAFFGMPGACNDINVVDSSPLFDEVMAGRFPPQVSYVVNGVSRTRGYYLTDGIYNRWSMFVQAYQEPVNQKERLFTKMQEAMRKDVERAFGVLQGKWHILARPCRLWQEEEMGQIIRACIILHNMTIEHKRGPDGVERVEHGVENAEDGSRANVTELTENSTASPAVGLSNRVGTIAQLCRSFAEVTSETGHRELRCDLVEHIWNAFGKNE